MLQAIEQTGFQQAMGSLSVAQEGDVYTDEQLRVCMMWLNAWGVMHIGHINDQPIETWGTVLDTKRRPDGDTIDQYVAEVIRRDEEEVEESIAQRRGQIREGGLIDRAQLQSLVSWAQAGLFTGRVWLFDGHTREYMGEAQIGKTKHGTKNISVKAIDQYTLFNEIPGLTEYFPTSVTYAEALKRMVSKANAVLPAEQRIRILAFDKEGWDADLLQWLLDEQDIIPITWIKQTASNRTLLNNVPAEEFVSVTQDITVGKSEQEYRVLQVADTLITFPALGERRVVVLETEAGTRLGIFAPAPHPSQAGLDNTLVMTTSGLIDTMGSKQDVENGFKVGIHEMDMDALPSHKVHQVCQREPYDADQAQHQLDLAHNRLNKYTAQAQHHQTLQAAGTLDQHEFNALSSRLLRLTRRTQRQVEQLEAEVTVLEVDKDGQTVLPTIIQALDLRKLTVLNLFKTHAWVMLSLLARLLGMDGAGPERLRREFLSHGGRVEFDHRQRRVTVYANPFPRARVQQAYEHLCSTLNDLPVTWQRDGLSYRVFFSW
jgi:hypothetical protein